MTPPDGAAEDRLGSAAEEAARLWRDVLGALRVGGPEALGHLAAAGTSLGAAWQALRDGFAGRAAAEDPGTRRSGGPADPQARPVGQRVQRIDVDR